jgi:hypothetical protein
VRDNCRALICSAITKSWLKQALVRLPERGCNNEGKENKTKQPYPFSICLRGWCFTHVARCGRGQGWLQYNRNVLPVSCKLKIYKPCSASYLVSVCPRKRGEQYLMIILNYSSSRPLAAEMTDYRGKRRYKLYQNHWLVHSMHALAFDGESKARRPS